jgi:hypothetical protein
MAENCEVRAVRSRRARIPALQSLVAGAILEFENRLAVRKFTRISVEVADFARLVHARVAPTAIGRLPIGPFAE